MSSVISSLRRQSSELGLVRPGLYAVVPVAPSISVLIWAGRGDGGLSEVADFFRRDRRLVEHELRDAFATSCIPSMRKNLTTDQFNLVKRCQLATQIAGVTGKASRLRSVGLLNVSYKSKGESKVSTSG